MAILSNADRADITEKFIRAFLVSQDHTADLDNAEIRTLVNDVDAWLDANQAAANSAITLAVRNKASNTTKFAALAWVALKRAGAI